MHLNILLYTCMYHVFVVLKRVYVIYFYPGAVFTHAPGHMAPSRDALS